MNSELEQHSQLKDVETGQFHPNSLITWPLFQLFRLIEWPMKRLQSLLGLGTMPYVFLLPNLFFLKGMKNPVLPTQKEKANI